MAHLNFRGACFALLLAFAASIAVAREDAASSAPVVAFGGEIAKPLELGAADLAQLPHTRVHAKAHGEEGNYDGVLLSVLLRAIGAPSGEAVRGPNLALYVRVRAADGYRAVFALGELDSSIGNANVILADRREGQPLDAKEGPFRIIAVADQRPARWVRQVVAIDVLKAPE
jgi:hypothetical protein